METLKEATASIVSYSGKLPCLEKSVEKGKAGEKELFSYLSENLSLNEYQLQKTNKQKHSGDILITKKDFNIICDVKNYSTPVPTTEVDKLKFDMFSTKIRCGLLVSYSSRVRNYNNVDMSLYHNEEGYACCIIILGNVEKIPEVILHAIYYLESIYSKILIPTIVKEESKSLDKRILDSFSGVYSLIQKFQTHKRGIYDSIDIFERQLQEQILCLKTILEKI